MSSLNSALNFQLKDIAGQGIGAVVNRATFITETQENYVWENGFLGSENGEPLCYTLVWVFGIQFALGTGQEHRNLRFKNSHLSFRRDEWIVNSYSIWKILVNLLKLLFSHLRIKRIVVWAKILTEKKVTGRKQ